MTELRRLGAGSWYDWDFGASWFGPKDWYVPGDLAECWCPRGYVLRKWDVRRG